MFWGINLKPNRKYTQTTEKSFHISQAALHSASANAGPTEIFISIENQRFLICTLRKEVCEQVMLDLNFGEGNEICFQSIGSGNVTLSGYVMTDDYLSSDEDEQEVESGSEIEVDLRNALNAKKAKKSENVKQPTKATKIGEGKENEDEEDEDDSDFDIENDDDEDAEGEEGAEGEEDESDDDEEDPDDEENSEDEVEQPKAKHPKLEKPEKQQNGVVKQKDLQPDKKSKKQMKTQDKQQKASNERVLSGGVKVVDLRVGTGADTKAGKRVQVFYEGRLLSNNKVFDSLKSGNGFKFSLGRGEVIKGWDVGLLGMKVGGKRRITCPPHMAYGSRGSPPAIPPNSTLVFEVELKSVN